MSSSGHRAGVVALCGRPNVGKSTLVNALVGADVAVVTAKPQTTREQARGIWSEPGFQAVLVDTPGIHRARSSLNRFMVRQAARAALGVDLVLLLVEAPLLDETNAAQWTPGSGARKALEVACAAGPPVGLLVTKIDRVADRRLLLPVLEAWSSLHEFAFAIPCSARSGEGLDALRREVTARLPEGAAIYEGERLSDRPLRWHVAEIVRGEIFERLGQELPYACAVVVTDFEEAAGRDRVRAEVHVERDSQRPILVGRNAAMIKAISMAARARMESLTGRACDLRLEVVVSPHWTDDERVLAQLGYQDPEVSQ
jgi:GTP-binding protein Era